MLDVTDDGRASYSIASISSSVLPVFCLSDIQKEEL